MKNKNQKIRFYYNTKNYIKIKYIFPLIERKKNIFLIKIFFIVTYLLGFDVVLSRSIKNKNGKSIQRENRK